MAEQQKQSKYAVVTVQGPLPADVSDKVPLDIDNGNGAFEVGFSYSPAFQRHSTRSRLLTHVGPTVDIDLRDTKGGLISKKQYRIVIDDQLRPEIVPCESEIPDIFCDDVEPEAGSKKDSFPPK